MTNRILLTITYSIICSVFAGSALADESQPDLSVQQNDFDISKHTVVVENPNYLRLQSCLGLVYDSITVLVPEECGYRSFSDIVVYDSVVYDSVVYDSVVYDSVVYDSVVYDSVDEFDEKNNAIKTVRDLDKPIRGRKWVALYLETKLKNKTAAKIAIPDLTCPAMWSCYYLATKNNQTLINRRGVEMTPDINSGDQSSDYFYVLVTSKHAPDHPEASYIPGAILFNEQREVVGFSLDEYSIYSPCAADKHKFYRAHFSENISRIFRKRFSEEM